MDWRERIHVVAADNLQKYGPDFLVSLLEDIKRHKPPAADFDCSPETIWWRQNWEDGDSAESLSKIKARLIHEISNLLIQRRFIENRAKLAHGVAARSTSWPIRVTLLDFHKGYLSRKAKNPPGYFPPAWLPPPESLPA